jgi:hypothetical protein
MNLPASFIKIKNSSHNAPSNKPKQANAGNKGERNSGNRRNCGGIVRAKTETATSSGTQPKTRILQ